jgi:DNA-binding response OmpR family regulator
MMPGYTGWEVLRYLRNKPRVRKIPELANVGVIMLTGIGETLNELSSPMYGADDYIDKPFKARDLLAKIKTVLEKKGFEIPDLDD